MAITDWEMDFVSELRARFDQFGTRMYLTARQADKLRKIAREA
jgi:hypothetical protein